jgi:hypothetical protein
MRARFSVALALAIAGALTISCGGIVDPSQNVTQTFTGTVAPGGVDTAKIFKASATGEFTVKITALSPSNNVVLGIDMSQGNSDGTTCSSQLVNRASFATLNVLAMNGQIFAGNYCLFVYDVGALTTTVTYTLSVSHP